MDTIKKILQDFTPQQFLNEYQSNPKPISANEQKANEYLYNDVSGYINLSNKNKRDIINAFIKGAEWKDEQFKVEKQQWIDKACEWMKNNMAYYCGYTSVYEDNLIEKFKKAMEAEL